MKGLYGTAVARQLMPSPARESVGVGPLPDRVQIEGPARRDCGKVRPATKPGELHFATLKREMHNADWIETAAVGTLSAKDFIETCNYRRRHSSINYRTPVEFELLHSLQKRSA